MNKTLDEIPTSLAGSKTADNLQEAFGAECKASVLYAWYAKAARKAGYEEIARVFDETAANEREHAEIWFRALGGHGDTAETLRRSAEGEHHEWTSMYRGYAATAREEGYGWVATLFEKVAEVEERHEKRYSHYLDRLEGGEMFTSESEGTRWICLNCGYAVVSKEAPKVCPACAHPQGYFRPETEEEARMTAKPSVIG